MSADRVERTIAYLSGDLDAASEDELEAALFDAPHEEIDALAELIGMLRRLGERGTYEPFVLPEEAARIRAARPRVLALEATHPRWEPSISVADDFEIFLSFFPVDLSGIERVEVAWEAPGVGEVRAMEARFDPAAGGLWLCCERELALRSTNNVVIRIYEREGDGRRLLRAFDICGSVRE
jgi:hypothetical protein